MNEILIITYDLKNPSFNFETLIQRIKYFGAWAKLGTSAFLIFTSASPTEVRDYLKEVLTENDKLFISVIKAPAAWFGIGNEVSSWIRDQYTKVRKI